MEEPVAQPAAEIAAHAERELEALVAVSSPSGDGPGAEEAIAVCAALLPPEARVERVPCSTSQGTDDLIARIEAGLYPAEQGGYYDLLLDLWV